MALYSPTDRENKIRSETDPYSRYYFPPRSETPPKMPSDEDMARMNRLTEINTFERPLTTVEVNELRSYDKKYGLMPDIRYRSSRIEYEKKRREYITKLKKFKNSRYGQSLSTTNIQQLKNLKSNYNALKRAENMLNFPHQLEKPENIPGEDYEGVPMSSVLGSILEVREGGKRRKTRRKQKHTKTRKHKK